MKIKLFQKAIVVNYVLNRCLGSIQYSLKTGGATNLKTSEHTPTHAHNVGIYMKE